MHPILKDVKTQMQDNATIIKIDVNKNQEKASIYQI